MPAPPLTLVIANKNYSSWSLRPWLAMTELGIAFTERLAKFDSEDWARNIDRLSPTRLVPVLGEGEPAAAFAPDDCLAIPERLRELQWTRTRAEFGAGGPFLFGGFSAADAFFAPVASRFVTYGVRIDGAAKAYQEALLNTQSMRAWTEAAVKETEFVAMDEPYA